MSIAHELRRDLRAATDHDERVTILFRFFEANGDECYEESVTQLEHGLQAAHLATEANADSDLITSALLHDIGHLIASSPEEAKGVDWKHEDVAASFLEELFSERVLEPIRLHVPAKRYLCTTDESYYDSLSSASKESFHLQGGKLSDDERRDFESTLHLERALELRRWDDLAKVVDWDVPRIEAYRAAVREALESHSVA